MADPFADALAGCECYQGVEHGRGCQPSAVDLTLDDAEECPLACAPLMVPKESISCAPLMVPKESIKRKGSVSGPEGDRGKRQRHCPQCPVKLTALPPQAREAELCCVFVTPDAEKPDACVPIPLWPQYNATWRRQPVPQHKWIHVGNYEPWVLRMVNSMTRRGSEVKMRAASQKVLETLRRGLNIPTVAGLGPGVRIGADVGEGGWIQ